MTDVIRQKILAKLESFNEYLGYLRQLKKEVSNEKQFISDFRLFGNTERYLQLCIQAIIDIVHLLIIGLGFKKPADNYEAISIIFDKGLISEDLASRLIRMVGLRNILVHEYGKIDRKEIYKVLKKQLGDLEEFRNQVIKRLRP